jgi:hypothetical protein
MAEHPMQAWIRVNGATVDELSAAMQQHALESGWTGELHGEQERSGGSPDEVDLSALHAAGQRLLTAALDAKAMPPPPDPTAAQHWSSSTAHLEVAANIACSDQFGSSIEAINAMAADYTAGVEEIRLATDAILRSTGQPPHDWSTTID